MSSRDVRIRALAAKGRTPVEIACALLCDVRSIEKILATLANDVAAKPPIALPVKRKAARPPKALRSNPCVKKPSAAPAAVATDTPGGRQSYPHPAELRSQPEQPQPTPITNHSGDGISPMQRGADDAVRQDRSTLELRLDHLSRLLGGGLSLDRRRGRYRRCRPVPRASGSWLRLLPAPSWPRHGAGALSQGRA